MHSPSPTVSLILRWYRAGNPPLWHGSGQIAGEGNDPIMIQVCCSLLFDSFQVEEVLLSLDLLHEEEILACIASRDQPSIRGEVAHVQRSDVLGKASECGILPD